MTDAAEAYIQELGRLLQWRVDHPGEEDSDEIADNLDVLWFKLDDAGRDAANNDLRLRGPHTICPQCVAMNYARLKSHE